VPPPTAALDLATARLAALDAAAPGLVAAFWLTGSAAAGDWWPERSDVDFVAATARPPEPADLDALAALAALAAAGGADALAAAALVRAVVRSAGQRERPAQAAEGGGAQH
jgi:hypothetical protein